MTARPLLLATLIVALVFLASLSTISAWGGQGHNATARLAQTLFTPAAINLTYMLLPDYGGQIDAISSWADNVRNQRNWTFSSSLHYVNTPTTWQCQYNVTRDCVDARYGPGMCVDGAVRNYTQRLQNASIDDYTQYREALEFLVHFVGDLHQPLHAGFASDSGGNGVNVTWAYSRSNNYNLHSLWDSGLIAHRVALNFSNSYSLWDKYLQQLMQTAYKDEVAQWITCDGPSQPGQFVPCSGQWVQESSDLCCQTVYVDEEGQHMSRNNGSAPFTLGDVYYQRNIDALEKRIIQAGVRMAYVINTVAAAIDPQPEPSSSSSSTAAASSSAASSSTASAANSTEHSSSSSSSSTAPVILESSSSIAAHTSSSSGSASSAIVVPSSSSSSSSTADVTPMVNSSSSTGTDGGSEESSGVSVAVVVGVLILVVVLAAVGVGMCLYRRKRKQAQDPLLDGSADSGRSRQLLLDQDGYTQDGYTRY